MNLCLNKNYTEACSLYQKELDFVLNGNDYFEIETYRLRNYVMHKEKIIDILEMLYYNNGAQFQLNEENMDILDIENLINSESKETIKIIVNFNEKLFASVNKKTDIKTNKLHFTISVTILLVDISSSGSSIFITNFHIENKPKKEIAIANIPK